MLAASVLIAACQVPMAMIGEQWLHSIVTEKSYLALAAMDDPETRLVNEPLRDFYSDTPKESKALKQFANQKLIRSLIELNGKARIRFYRTESILNLDVPIGWRPKAISVIVW